VQHSMYRYGFCQSSLTPACALCMKDFHAHDAFMHSFRMQLGLFMGGVNSDITQKQVH
jgi:hypothetical protein